MATYIPGVQSYMPDMKPFTPDYQFLGNILDVKTNRYNTNYKAINDLYSKVVYGDLSRKDNQETRNHFAETLAPQLQKVSGMDLSVMQNAEAARAIFKPFFEDDLIVRDLVVTRQYMNEMDKANMMQTSPSDEVREQYWDVGVKKMQYEMEDFINASPEEAMQMRAPKYVPDADLYQRGKAYLEGQGYDVKIDYVDPANPQWIVTRKNGELVTKQAMFDMQQALLDDPMVQNAYYADAFVKSRDFANSGMQEGTFANVKDGQAAWANQTINEYEQKLAAQNVMLQEDAKQERSVLNTWDNYKKEDGIIPGSKEDEQLTELEKRYDATIARLNKNKNVLADTRGVQSDNLDSLLNRAYNIIMQTNMNTDLMAAATQWASTHSEVSLKENPFEKQRRQFAHDFEKQKRKQIFEWQKKMLDKYLPDAGKKGKSGSSKSGDDENPQVKAIRDLIIQGGPQQSGDPLTLAEGYAGTGSIIDKIKNNVYVKNQEVLNMKQDEFLDDGLNAAINLYTQMYKNDRNVYSPFKTGITGTPEEIKKELMAKPNEAAKFINDMYNVINVSDGGTFADGAGPGMAGKPEIKEGIKKLREVMANLITLENMENNLDEHNAENYQRFITMGADSPVGKHAQVVQKALKSGIPSIMHEDSRGKAVPYTYAEYLPILMEYAKRIGINNLSGHNLNDNGTKPFLLENVPVSPRATGRRVLSPQEQMDYRTRVYQQHAANRLMQTEAKDGNLFYDIWKGQNDAFIRANDGTYNMPTEDGSVMFPIFNVQMAFEGYTPEQMNVGDIVQTTSYKSFFNPLAIESSMDGAKEYLTFSEQYKNKGAKSEYVIDFYNDKGQKFQQTLAKEVMDELIARVRTAATDPKTTKGEIPKMDITYIPNVNPSIGALTKNSDGDKTEAIKDAAGYLIRPDAAFMKKIMAGRTAKGETGSSPTLIGSADIAGYNNILFTFKKEKDMNEKAYSSQEAFSTTLYEVENSENKIVPYEYPMGGKMALYKNHMGQLMVDFTMSQYNAQTGNHEYIPTQTKNLTQEWLQTGVGPNWYDFKVNQLQQVLEDNASTQSTMEQQNKQEKSNILKK